MARQTPRGPFVLSAEIDWSNVADRHRHPFDLPALEALGELDLRSPVTFFVGGNGSGKSTLIEAIAAHQGLNPEGGSDQMDFSTVDRSVSDLHKHLRVARGPRPSTRYFLRAESFFNVATAVDDYGATDSYGDISLHELSHGESFLALVHHRFTPGGWYCLDEPEAALSVRGLLELLVLVHEHVQAGSQFVIATHSPILMAYPGATIYEFSDGGVERVAWDDVDTVGITRSFLDAPNRFLQQLGIT